MWGEPETIRWVNNEIPYCIIDNYYTPEELKLIWEELDFLCYDSRKKHLDYLTQKEKLKPPSETGSASVGEGSHERILKNNSALNLDGVYADRDVSNILQINQRVIKEFHETLAPESPNWFFKNGHKTIHLDVTLLSYYEDGGYYEPHVDSAVYTIFSWFHKEPKRYTGGDLVLTDIGDTIEARNNRVVIIPSFAYHEVLPIVMEDEYVGTKQGRWCMAQFLGIPFM